MAPAQDRRLLRKANGRPADYLIDSDEAQELHDLREMLDRMVEDSACSICYEPLRKMFTASCGHSYCIRLEDQLEALRKWASRRKAQDDETRAAGRTIPATACSWRRNALEIEHGHGSRDDEADADWVCDWHEEEPEPEPRVDPEGQRSMSYTSGDEDDNGTVPVGRSWGQESMHEMTETPEPSEDRRIGDPTEGLQPIGNSWREETPDASSYTPLRLLDPGLSPHQASRMGGLTAFDIAHGNSASDEDLDAHQPGSWVSSYTLAQVVVAGILTMAYGR
ncbi:hypothetical protein EsH8_V_000015 [Colletotrichum jinshuiense]